MGYNEIDRRVVMLAMRQHAVVGRSELLDAGLTERMIDHRLHRRFLRELAPSTYALDGYPATWQRQYKAAELSVPGSAIAGLAAARVHELESFKVVRPEVVGGYTRSVRSTLATVHRSSGRLTTTVDGIRVTTVAQTLFDIVARVDVRRLERATDGALLDRKMAVDELVERLVAHERSRKPGIATWRALVGERAGDGWSPPESVLEALLWDAFERVPGHPDAFRQASPPWWPPGAGRHDIVVPAWRLILEADGRRWHARVHDFDSDRWRDNVAAANGYRVQRFTYTHLTTRLSEVTMTIAAAGAATTVRAAA